MPLPIIPIVIGAFAGTGVGVSLLAGRKMRKDKKRYEARRKVYEQHHDSYVVFVSDVNAELDDLHEQRVAAQETLRQAADFLVRANVKERNFDVESEITPEEFAELKKVLAGLSDLAAGIGAGLASGASIGAATAAGTYAAVGAFGTASTGTAIGSLAGVAARNATLAWLGGGSLAAGGGGVAAGMVSLVGIVTAPLAVVPAIVMGVKAQNQSKRIDEEISKMDVSEAKIGKHRAEVRAVGHRVQEMSKSVSEVEQSLKDTLGRASVDVVEDVYRVASVAKALAELLDLGDSSEPTTTGNSERVQEAGA